MTRLKEIRNAHNMTQQEVADYLGIAVVTYNRLERGHTRLTTERMDKLAALYKINPSDLIAAPPSARIVAVLGRVCAGHWADGYNWEDPADEYSIAIPDDEKYRSVALHGAETSGPSMNQRYPDGTVLVFTNQIETQEDIVAGQRYIVERERINGQRETTVKRLIRDDDGKYWLMPESDDPRHQTPIELSGKNGDLVRILGRVVYSVRRED